MAGSSVEIEHCTPASSSVGSGWSARGRDGAGAQVREGAGRVEHDSAAGDLRPPVRSPRPARNPVPDPVGVQRLDRALHAGRARHLAGVRHARQPEVARQLERVETYSSGGYSAWSPPRPTPSTPRSRVQGGGANRLERLLLREAARDVGRQADLDAVPLARLVDAVAEPGEDLVPGRPAAHPLGRREDRLEVDGAVRGRLGCVVDRDLAEVVGPPEGVRGPGSRSG